MPRAGTRSASSDDDLVWFVPESLRPRLAERYGPVLTGSDADARYRSLDRFATCGDRVTSDALRLGLRPFLALVDGKTLRNEPIDLAAFAAMSGRHLRVVNPPGTLTQRLRSAVRELVESGGGVIEVEGEEDLGALALVESLPAGTTVIYGIPGAGASFVRVDARAKEDVRTLLNAMELRRLSDGP